MGVKLQSTQVETLNKSLKLKTNKRTLDSDEPDILEDGENADGVKRIKTKTDAEDLVEAELENCELLLKDGSGELIQKLESLTQLFDAILKNNVNTAILKDDFPVWVKDAILNILSGVEKVSEKLFRFLVSALKVAPTSFESVSEKVLTICIFYPRQNVKVQSAYDEFMTYLVTMFERLRRFPKLIAKILLCVRNYFSEVKSAKTKPRKDEKFESILSPKFMESIGPVVNLLPSGQVIDLWKSLVHNLEFECVKPICDNNDDVKTHQFFSIVTDLFVEILNNTKLTDYTVPGATVEKITDIMIKLRDDCLKVLGITLLERAQETQLVKPFLKLTYTWGQLHGILLCYNFKYKIDRPTVTDVSSNPTDLVYFYPFLTSENWIEISNRVLNCQDAVAKGLLVKMVGQKLTYMTAFEHKNNRTESSLVSVNQEQEENCINDASSKDYKLITEERLKAAAEFIWTHQEFLDVSDFDETLALVDQYVDSHKMIELAGNLVKQMPSSCQEEINESSRVEGVVGLQRLTQSVNPKFHYALVLEAMGEIIRRIGKMKLLSKSVITIMKEALSVENRSQLLSHPNDSKTPSKFLQNFLAVVNSLIDDNNGASECKKTTTRKSTTITEDFSSDLITGMLQFIASLELENYPKELKTGVFLCASVILVALTEQKIEDEILNVVAKILIDSGSQSHGNEIIFSLQWINFYKWFSSNINRFNEEMQKNLLGLILTNIYVSPKLVSEFDEKELNTLCESFELTTSTGHVTLITLEFFLKELQGTKTKLTSQVQNHTRKLAQFVVEKLIKMDNVVDSSVKSAKKRMSSSSANLSNLYHACWLCQLSMKIISEDQLSSFKSILSSKVKSALKLVKHSKATEDDGPEKQIFAYAMKFLHSVCKSIEDVKDVAPNDIVIKLWKTCINQKMWMSLSSKECHSSEPIIPKNLIKTLYETANPEDLIEISASITSLIANSSVPENFNREDIALIIHLLDELVDAELGADRKQFRRQILEESLHTLLPVSLQWTSDIDSLEMNVLPYIQFQTKLLRRRGAMVNVTTLAVCLSTITSVPLNKIDDIKVYRKVFSSLANLLNTFAVHRLDVLSFRSHVYLQGFQFVIESLAKKADQKNKLTDEEIYDLRHCAHSIERICQSVKLGQKEFNRVSPYFVAVLMRQFEIFTVYPAVKNSLLSGSYKLLDICDEQGIAQLNSLLTIGSREVFKTVYELYKKYYQYKGRV